MRVSRRGLAVAVLALVVVIGCSGLDPSRPDLPVDPNSPCALQPQVVTAFPNGFGPVGTDTTLDLATWNIQNFPKANTTTVDRIVTIINTLNIDIYAVQEIEDTTQFRALMNRLPEYGGFYSPDVYSRGFYQKTGIIYRKSVVTVNSAAVPAEFRQHSYSFVDRLPMDISLSTHSNGHTYDFHLMVVHLKAGASNEEDAVRRRAATEALRTYMNAKAVEQPGVDYVVAGDWNDHLNEPLSYNSFPAFLTDAGNYKFLSMALVGQSSMNSHPLGLIDQLLVNRNACPDFTAGRITTLRMDQLLEGYTTYVSDHRPVLISAPVFK
jgi:endonuclease/exonuclease/phosphatase family metal-dependent hydrolase